MVVAVVLTAFIWVTIVVVVGVLLLKGEDAKTRLPETLKCSKSKI